MAMPCGAKLRWGLFFILESAPHLSSLRASMKFLFALSLLLPVAGALAQETPTITIRKGDKLNIGISSISGADGAAAAKILQNDLTLSGYFNIVPAANANFVVSGSSSGASLSGNVTEKSGKTVLSQTFSGSARSKVHQFADEIVETLTGNRGIANTKIAFVATKTGRKEIYTCDADGAGVVQLTRDNNISVAPSLSADGRRILYTGYKSGYADVYEINLGSGARNRIIKYPGTNSGATFSPDGGQIAVTLSKDGNPELYVTGSGGGGARRLTRTAGVESSPTWSPDGGEIIYSSDTGGSPQLFRISAGGGSPRAISTGHGYNTEPSWSPDAKKVAFNVRGGGSFAVAIHEFGGGTRTVGDGQDPVWGANSRHLIFASGGALILLDAQTGQRTTLLNGLGKISEPAWSR
jgi:TolB protein